MPRSPILQGLDKLEEKCKSKDPTLEEIIDVFSRDGHYVLILFLIVPFLQPIPLLGLSTPFGILIGLIAIFAQLGKKPWVPKKWSAKQISSETVSKIAEASERIFEKLSFFFKPRMRMLLHKPFRSLNTTIILLNAILLALPLPIPFSNAMPGWAILLQALGHLEDDGALVLLSYAQTIATLTFFFFLSETIKSLLRFF